MADKYRCPHCKVSMGTSIKLSTPPTHKCQKRAGRVLPLEPVEKPQPEPPSA